MSLDFFQFILLMQSCFAYKMSPKYLAAGYLSMGYTKEKSIHTINL